MRLVFGEVFYVGCVLGGGSFLVAKSCWGLTIVLQFELEFLLSIPVDDLCNYYHQAGDR